MTCDDEDQADEPAVVCLSCLVRPPRPGSLFCSRLCRVLHAVRRLWAAELPRLPRAARL